eukprot:gnl/TRDRNA2_/TRDRNA2_85458_c0_seq2.p1 gnl/TRDRNA2_/TRDRNA2_85458_c0~~gnl/TRDRNA2_/TRDRNA2_85458_c0_seq2.p1  ORF type:complete len:267 (+),score=21.85 gnl/TRDRNA2_/TRDRNA2_85458_c0_seq2:48-848(+)
MPSWSTRICVLSVCCSQYAAGIRIVTDAEAEIHGDGPNRRKKPGHSTPSITFHRQCGESSIMLEHDGWNRTASLYVPPRWCHDPTERPMIVALHCYGCADGAWGFKELNQAADMLGWMLLLPRGIEAGKHRPSWNGGACCGLAVRENVDDVGFLDTLVAKVASTSGVDRAAMFLIGWSNGGFMTTRMLAEGTTRFRAAATLSGWDERAVSRLQSNHNPQAVPVLHMSSRNDMAVRYGGCCEGVHVSVSARIVSAPARMSRRRRSTG